MVGEQITFSYTKKNNFDQKWRNKTTYHRLVVLPACADMAVELWQHGEKLSSTEKLCICRETWDIWPQALCECLPCALEWTNELMTECLGYMDESLKNHLGRICSPHFFLSPGRPQKDRCPTFRRTTTCSNCFRIMCFETLNLPAYL